ncbi:MAG: C-terminal binding protein [Coriobacteriales bacterium]|jgi:D-3-phosphoglycerate dehydrogenase
MDRICITDLDFEDTNIEAEACEKAGIELVAYQDRTSQGIVAHAAGADAVLTSYGDFNAAVIDKLAGVKAICKTGIGVDNIDVEAATAHGIAVCNVPGYGTEIVSDHAIALALGCLRRINELDANLRAGTWEYARCRPLGQVRGRTFGVVGMGEIGRAVARKANGLGFRVVCSSRSLVPGRTTPEGYPVLELDELFECADIVSVHVALVPETAHLVDERRLALMKPGAILVNTSRGGTVDTVALARALEENKLWGAGIDVFETEPIEPDHPLLSAPHTLLTPHAAYWSEESGRELRTRAIGNLIEVLQTGRCADCVNPSVFE